ncbi:MAG: glutamate racemase [Bacillota bacterium]
MPTIGVFDSGYGGLTVLKEVMDKIPGANTEYYADNGRNPYGVRPREEIARFSRQILDFLAGKGVDVAIIACNTATAAAMSEVEHAYPFPIVGVIGSGAKGAVAATRNKKVGVIATEFTIKSRAYQEAIRALDPQIEVIGQPCMRLVRLVETGNTTGDEARRIIREDLAVFAGTGIDTLVLGCTHFPLLSSLIAEVMGPGVNLVDPAAETAVEALAALKGKTSTAGCSAPTAGYSVASAGAAAPHHNFYTSGEPEEFKRLGSGFLGREIKRAEKVVFV